MPYIHCGPCINFQQVCSFEMVNWGVDKWLLIKAHEPASKPHPKTLEARKNWDSADKQLEQGLSHVKNVEISWKARENEARGINLVDSVSQDTALNASFSQPVIPVVHPPTSTTDLPTQPPLSHTHTPKPSTSSRDDVRDREIITGRIHQVIVRSFHYYEDTLTDPNQTPAVIRIRIAELNSLCNDERTQAMAFMKLIEDRNTIVQRVIKRLLKEAKRLDRIATEGTPNMVCCNNWDNTVRDSSSEMEDVEDQLHITSQLTANKPPVSDSEMDMESS